MNAQVKLYNVGFNSNMNCVVDNIATYLKNTATTVITYDNVMYQKIELDMEIKLPITESLVERPSFNYVSILNQDGQRPFYFFVRDVQWLSQQGIKVLLSMDTLNTFQDLLVFSNNTKITRQHKDRFYQEYYDTQRPQLATRKIDRPSEVTGLTKYRGTTKSVSGTSDIKWYLVYANENDNANAPVACYIMPSAPVKFYGLHDTYGPQYFNTGDTGDIYLIKENVTLTLTTTTNQTVTLNITNDQTYYISTVPVNIGNYFNVIGKGASTQSYGCTAIGFSGLVHLSYYPKAQASDLLSLATSTFIQVARNADTDLVCTSSGTFNLSPISNINRTYSSLIKIIECPYEPFTLSAKDDGYLLDDGFYANLVSNLGETPVIALKLNELSKEFVTSLHTYSLSDFTCTIPLAKDRQYAKKDAKYESKLYHSDFHNVIFNYDSFTKDMPLENIEPSGLNNPYFKIKYKQANTITSNLGFKFEIARGTQKLNDKFEEYLICKRNNEYPIYNSSYLNYLRNGYNYDLKAKNLQTAQSWIGTGLALAGGIAGFAVGGAVGAASGISFVTSSISSLSTAIMNNIQNEASIEQKLNEAKNTTNSVNSSDDLNLLNWYSDNLLWATTYDISNEQKSNVFDLFYKTGYACNETGIPNVNSRYRFNYLQCTPDFTTKANPIWQEYINDVIARFELGVTYFHTYHDFEQQYENWESWLIA